MYGSLETVSVHSSLRPELNWIPLFNLYYISGNVISPRLLRLEDIILRRAELTVLKLVSFYNHSSGILSNGSGLNGIA